MQTIAWRVLLDRLLTQLNLEDRGIILDSNLCVMCGVEENTMNHVFFKCKIAWLVWSKCSQWIGEKFVNHSEV